MQDSRPRLSLRHDDGTGHPDRLSSAAAEVCGTEEGERNQEYEGKSSQPRVSDPFDRSQRCRRQTSYRVDVFGDSCANGLALDPIDVPASHSTHSLYGLESIILAACSLKE